MADNILFRNPSAPVADVDICVCSRWGGATCLSVRGVDRGGFFPQPRVRGGKVAVLQGGFPSPCCRPWEWSIPWHWPPGHKDRMWASCYSSPPCPSETWRNKGLLCAPISSAPGEETRRVHDAVSRIIYKEGYFSNIFMGVSCSLELPVFHWCALSHFLYYPELLE